MVGLVVYFYSRGLTDNLGFAVHFTMPVSVDTWLGGGVTPTQRLQAAWCGSPCGPETPPRWYDVALTTVYMSHFLAGLTIAAVLWVRDRVEWVPLDAALHDHQLRRTVRLHPLPDGAAVDGGARRATCPAGVHRITGRGWADLGLGHLDRSSPGVGNPVAAMPSLHAGMTCLIAMYAIQRLRSPLALAAAGATRSRCRMALVYFGEHYVVDVLAGCPARRPGAGRLQGLGGHPRDLSPGWSVLGLLGPQVDAGVDGVLVDRRELLVGERRDRPARRGWCRAARPSSAPMTAEVTRGSRSAHCSAIWASFWPRACGDLVEPAHVPERPLVEVVAGDRRVARARRGSRPGRRRGSGR